MSSITYATCVMLNALCLFVQAKGMVHIESLALEAPLSSWLEQMEGCGQSPEFQPQSSYRTFAYANERIIKLKAYMARELQSNSLSRSAFCFVRNQHA